MPYYPDEYYPEEEYHHPHPPRPRPTRYRSHSTDSYFPPRYSEQPRGARDKASKTSPILVVGLLAAAVGAFHIWHAKREEREQEDRKRRRKAFDKAKRARRKEEDRRDRRADAEEDEREVDVEMESVRRRRISYRPDRTQSMDGSRLLLEAPSTYDGRRESEDVQRIGYREERDVARDG